MERHSYFTTKRIFTRSALFYEKFSLPENMIVSGALSSSQISVTFVFIVCRYHVQLFFQMHQLSIKIAQNYSSMITGAVKGSIHGANIYSDDLNPATATVYAGVLGIGETKIITIKILPG